MPPRKSDPAAPEGVEVLPDGRIRLAWTGHDVTLRRPLVEEWLSYLEEGEAADEWRPTDDEGNPRPRGYKDLLSATSPYRGLYTRILEELGGETIAREELPVWCSDGRLVGTFAEVWLSVPLIPSRPR